MSHSLSIEYEVRTFEQRFGKRCFCGKSWGDPSPCGDSRAEWTIQKALGALFADRRGAKCEICDKDIAVQRRFCLDCGLSREKYRAGQDRHRRVSKVCAVCAKEYVARADKKSSRYCSLSCANRGRHLARV